MGPVGSGRNVLTIDIPVEWENTEKGGATGPNFWARLVADMTYKVTGLSARQAAAVGYTIAAAQSLDHRRARPLLNGFSINPCPPTTSFKTTSILARSMALI